MAAIYCISIFIFIYYFGIGYKRIQTSEYPLSTISLVILGIILRLSYLKLNIFSMVSLINVGADFASAFLIYQFAKQHYDKPKSLICASLYLFNPTMAIYSCVWGSSLSVWAFFIIGCVWCVYHEKQLLACILFSISCYTYVGKIGRAHV